MGRALLGCAVLAPKKDHKSRDCPLQANTIHKTTRTQQNLGTLGHGVEGQLREGKRLEHFRRMGKRVRYFWSEIHLCGGALGASFTGRLL